jgi:hypothetical protein
MAIDWTKPVQTRDGRKVRVLCTDGPDLWYSVIGMVDGRLCPETWTIDGVHFANGVTSNLDIINTPDPPVTVTRWVNVYSGGRSGYLHSDLLPDRATADRHACPDRIACVPVWITYRPGEGLD